MRLNNKEIIKLLDNLIGQTEAVGDSALDEENEYNLKTLIDVTNWCLDGISQSASTRHCQEYSMRRIGERAFSALCEWKEWIEEQMESD